MSFVLVGQMLIERWEISVGKLGVGSQLKAEGLRPFSLPHGPLYSSLKEVTDPSVPSFPHLKNRNGRSLVSSQGQC